MRIRNAVLALLAGLATMVPALAESPVPPGHQATILARALAYDRALEGRVGATLTLGIVYESSDPASVASRADMLQAFRALKDRTIKNKPLEVIDHIYDGASDLRRWMGANNVDVIYLTPGLGSDVDRVIAAAVDRKVVVLSPLTAYVERGAAIGVVLEGRKPRILVNLSRAQEVGMELDPQLLQLAKLVR